MSLLYEVFDKHELQLQVLLKKYDITGNTVLGF